MSTISFWSSKQENERISQNISVANDSVRYYKDRAGEHVATIGALSYTVGEYERFMAKDKETINDMKIKDPLDIRTYFWAKLIKIRF